MHNNKELSMTSKNKKKSLKSFLTWNSSPFRSEPRNYPPPPPPPPITYLPTSNNNLKNESRLNSEDSKHPDDFWREDSAVLFKFFWVITI